MVQVRSVSAGKGVSWFVTGWRNFMRAPGMWLLLATILTVSLAILGRISPIAGLITWLASPVLLGGLLFAAREVEEGRPVRIVHLIRGFEDSRALWRMTSLGALLVVMVVLSLVLGIALIGEATMTKMQTAPGTVSFDELDSAALTGFLGILVLQLLVLTAVGYAVPLVMFDGASVGQGLRASLFASVRNVLPLLVFSLIYLLAILAAAIPLLLVSMLLFSTAALLWFPIFLSCLLLPPSVGMLYASYRDCFSKGNL